MLLCSEGLRMPFQVQKQCRGECMGLETRIEEGVKKSSLRV